MAREYRRKGELVDAFAADSTLGRRIWWEQVVQSGLGRLRDSDLVEYTRDWGCRWIERADHTERDIGADASSLTPDADPAGDLAAMVTTTSTTRS